MVLGGMGRFGGGVRFFRLFGGGGVVGFLGDLLFLLVLWVGGFARGEGFLLFFFFFFLGRFGCFFWVGGSFVWFFGVFFVCVCFSHGGGAGPSQRGSSGGTFFFFSFFYLFFSF